MVFSGFAAQESENSVQKRGWPAIVIDVLEASLTPTSKWRIMYKSNLNFDRFNRYFSDLLRKNFVEEMSNGNGKRVFKTTERGRALLKALRDAQKLMS